jgi:crotonobetainyl-CoA:carnitine CoA-transferase CaiB-like acyl-CoA transferase
MRVYETSDGGHVTVSAAESHFWANLCRHFGREDFIPHQFDQGAKRLEMLAFFETAFRQRTRDEWWELLRDKQVCIAPVLGVDEALTSLQALHREMVVECTHPIAGPIRTLGNPMKFSNAKPQVTGPAPLLGEHSEELAQFVGLDAARVRSLLEKGILRSTRQTK